MTFRLALAALALSTSATAFAAEQRFSLGSFEELIVEGDLVVNLETGNAPAAKAEGPRNKLGALRVDRQGKVVRIRTVGFPSNRNDSGPMTISVSGRNIRKIALIGTGKLTVNKLDADLMRIELRGAGAIDVASLTASKLVAMLVGTGSLHIAKGSALTSEVAIDGGAQFVSAGMVSQKLQLVQSGPASTLLTVENTAEINNSGSGSITIEGSGTCLIRKAGNARINCKKTGQ
jgi:Putative auto-transporter adhesin, head GIN domain